MQPQHPVNRAWPSRSGSIEQALDRRALLAAAAGLAAAALPSASFAQAGRPQFRRISTQFIAALAHPQASAGSNAEQWGLWRRDPGPRGVRLSNYGELKAAGGVAPANWRFDAADWWLEENGLIMEQPEFPLAAGQYLVTGDRAVTAVLTVHTPDAAGAQRWVLDNASVYDVTHLRCRSARYTPAAGTGSCTPAAARQGDFPVTPGAEMPPVEGCSKQDYAVLFVIGVPAEA